jgi:hypothetical protein
MKWKAAGKTVSLLNNYIKKDMKKTIIYIEENGYPVFVKEDSDEILTNGDNVEISSDYWSYVNNVLENEEEEANEAEILEEFAASMGYELHYLEEEESSEEEITEYKKQLKEMSLDELLTGISKHLI